MARTSSQPAQMLAQTNTYNMNTTNPQDRPLMTRCYPCAIFLTVISCIIIFMGIVNTAVGASFTNKFSGSYYESFPSAARSDRNQMYAGIALLIVGVILMIVSIVWCRKIKRNFSPPVMYSGTTMTTTVVAPPPGIVQPPNVQGSGGQTTYVYSYQPAHQAGSVQQGQTATYPLQYRPVQPAGNQLHPTAPPSAPPEDISHQPPPSYNELMNPEKNTTKSYGCV